MYVYIHIYVYISIHTHIYIYIYYIYMYIYKTMCPSGHHQNGFVTTHALGHMMYSYTLLVQMNQKVFNNLSKEHNTSGHK